MSQVASPEPMTADAGNASGLSSLRTWLQSDRLRWTIWKENRLVLPLFFSLVGVIFLVMLLRSFVWFDSRMYVRNADRFLPLLFPTLMAFGLSIILVLQEREQRTLDWLRTLPISSGELMRFKVAVALVWLVGCWLLSIATDRLLNPRDPISLTEIAAIGGNYAAPIMPLSFPFWIVQSFMILAAGAYASWKFPTALGAVATTCGIVAIPLLVAASLDSMYRLPADDASRIAFYGNLILILPLAALGYWQAKRTLSPALPTPPSRLTGQSQAEQSQSAAALAHSDLDGAAQWGGTACQIRASYCAIIWQTIASTWRSLALFAAMFVGGLVLLFGTVAVQDDNAASPIIAILSSISMVLALAWSGVIIFQGDGSQASLRFLADRGHRAGWSLLARHVVTIAMLSSLALVYMFASTWFTVSANNQSEPLWIPSPLAVVLIGATLYSVSAWVSQLVREPIIAYLVGPIVALIALAWLIFTCTEMLAPLWLVLVIGVVMPVLITGIQMRRFADGTDRPLCYVLAAAGLVLLVAVPLLPAVQHVRAIDRPDSTLIAQWLDEGIGRRQKNGTPVVLRFMVEQLDESATVSQGLSTRGAAYRVGPNDEEMGQAIDRLLRNQRRTPDELVDELNILRRDPSRSARPGSKAFLGNFYHALELARVSASNAGDDGGMAQADKELNLNQWIDAASRIAAAFRLEDSWIVQDSADVLEIWLADVLNDSELVEIVNQQTRREAIDRLPQSEQRDLMRRSAVLSSWAQFATEVQRHRYTSFAYDKGIQKAPSSLIPWSKVPRSEAIVSAVISGLEAGDTVGPAWRRKLHNLMGGDPESFDDGPYGPKFRSHPAVELIRPYDSAPAVYWHMDWEDSIDRLKSQVEGDSDNE